MKSGFVAIVGRPNVGKSTFLNRALGRKVAIVSRKPGTTRMRILGIRNTENAQTVFIDTPGVPNSDSLMNLYLKREIDAARSGVDLLLFMRSWPHARPSSTGRFWRSCPGRFPSL